MSKTGLIGTVVVLALIAAGAYIFFMQPSPMPADTQLTGSESQPQGQVSGTNEVPSGTGSDTSGTGTGTGTGSISGSVDANVVISSAPTAVSVVYDGTSFTPREVTIKRGGTVTWKNQSGGTMWVASAQHPSHTVYDGTTRQEHCAAPSSTTFDQCKGGSDYSFAFSKTGTWNYHDHINASAFGSVKVVE